MIVLRLWCVAMSTESIEFNLTRSIFSVDILVFFKANISWWIIRFIQLYCIILFAFSRMPSTLSYIKSAHVLVFRSVSRQIVNIKFQSKKHFHGNANMRIYWKWKNRTNYDPILIKSNILRIIFDAVARTRLYWIFAIIYKFYWTIPKYHIQS